MFDQEEIVDRRREIVRHWYMMQTAVPVIIERLSDHDDFALLDPTLRYREKVKVIQDDILAIRRDIGSAINVAEIDAKEAHAVYIARTEYHYGLALQAGNIELAQKLNKDSAKAKGVQTEEPIVIKGDILEIMREASARAQRIAQEEVDKQNTIDVTPQQQLPEPEVSLVESPQVPSPSPLSILKRKPT